MDEQQHDALLERAGSAETMTVPRSNSNMKAFKVAGLTVLACLLLAGQAMTAYFILGQKDHLSALEKGQENLKKELTRRVSASPKMMHMPMNSMPMLQAFDVDDDSPKSEAKPEGKKDTIMSTRFISQREGSGIPDGSRVGFRRPQMSMQSLPLLFDENASETPALKIEGKCELDAKKGVKPGFYTPQCDEHGHYLPKQCWHSTGYCWCVDKNGERIEGTLTREHLECGGVNEKPE